jgi:hypothetical protein
MDDLAVGLIVGVMMLFVVAGIAAMVVQFRSHAIVDEEKGPGDHKDQTGRGGEYRSPHGAGNEDRA